MQLSSHRCARTTAPRRDPATRPQRVSRPGSRAAGHRRCRSLSLSDRRGGNERFGDARPPWTSATPLPRTRSSGRREAVQASASMSSLAEARLASPIVDCCFAGVVGVWNVAGGRVLRVPSSDERPSAPPRRRARHRSALAQRSTDRCSSFTSPTVVCRPTARRRAPGTASPVAPAVSSSKALGRGRRRPGERRRVVRTDQAWIARTPLERFDRTIYSPARTGCMLTNHGSLASGQGGSSRDRVRDGTGNV